MLLYILFGITILLTLYNLIATRSLKKQIADTKDSFHGTIQWAKDDLRSDLLGIRSVMKVMAKGGKITPDMVDEGRPWADMSAADTEKFLRNATRAVVIDVRTPSEYLAGHIPGARLIPVDEIEIRSEEVPKDAEPIFLVCQGGTRSAAACEILSKKGFVNLVNIYDGTGSWPGKKEMGPAIRPPVSLEQ